VARGVDCVTSLIDERCEQCHRFHRSCELASPWTEFDKLAKEEDKIRQERWELEMKRMEIERKTARLRRQERALRKRMRDLGNREDQNILDLEAEEAAAEAVAAAAVWSPPAGVQSPTGLSLAGAQSPTGLSLAGAQSPTGLSLASFGSFGRTSPVPTGSS